jgi:nitrogenase molybdenum-iron protein alpha chain
MNSRCPRKINVDLAEAPIRETRLGSITGYSGTAAELCRKSCDGSLRERERSFTQAATCASVTAICQLAMIRDAAVVNHGALGCAGDFANFNFINRAGQVKRGRRLRNAHLINSNILEDDIVFGGEAKLKGAIRGAYERFSPRVIFITTSCASGIIGDDVSGIADELERELGIPLVPVSCEGFRSQVWASGFDAAYHAILRRVVKPPHQKREDVVNVINFWGDDIFTELFGRLGLVPNFVVPFSDVDQLERLSEARATVQICPTLGTYLAAGLEQQYGVVEVKAPPPYGLEPTDRWLRELGKVTGREVEVEALIAQERERIAPELDELRQRLKGLRAFIAAGAVHGHSIVAVLRELGIEVLGATVWHHDPVFDHGDPAGDTLDYLVADYGDLDFSVCDKQSFEMVNLLNRLKPDIFIVRHNGMSVWGAKLGIPTFLMGDEHFGIGYQGLLNYGHKILDAVSNPAFVRNLARHTRLPYSDWWLNQTPFTFLEEAQ